MPSWSSFEPFIPIGLALGGVYALSGVGMVVLYRATGVLNLAYGAIGAMGAMIAWSVASPRWPTAPSSARPSLPATRSSRPWRRSASR